MGKIILILKNGIKKFSKKEKRKGIIYLYDKNNKLVKQIVLNNSYLFTHLDKIAKQKMKECKKAENFLIEFI